MTTYGSTITRGSRVVDGDVAKGIKPWEQKKALARAKDASKLKFGPPVKTPIEPSAAARAKGSKVVEKGVGIAPVLARRTAAAGRGGRRVLTGDAVNVRRIIGKNDEVAKAGIPGGIKLLGSAIKQPKALGAGLKGGFMAGRTGATRLASPAAAGGRVGQTIGHAVGANPMKAGMAAGGAVGVGAMAGNGHRNRRDAMYAPSYAAPSYGAPSPFGKRSYDPEGERRYRQGAAAAASGIGAGHLLQRGVRDVKRDTKALRAIPQGEKRVVPPPLSENHPGGRKAGQPRDPKVVQARAREIENATAHNTKLAEASRKLRGALVTRRSAGKIAGGTALLGLSGALIRNRNEERWD